MHIRSATVADVPAMFDLERQCPTAAHWSERQYEELFLATKGGCDRFVLVADGGAEDSVEPEPSPLLGFLIARHLHPEWELENLVVAPDFRRKGLATSLFTALLARTREIRSESIFLEVRESNQAARGLYVRLGFQERGRRKLYYSNPYEDAVLYRMALI